MNGDRYGRGGVGLGDGDQGSELDLDFEDEENDVKRMGRIWVKERGTVEIMPWEGDLIDGLFDKLEQQVSNLDNPSNEGGPEMMAWGCEWCLI